MVVREGVDLELVTPWMALGIKALAVHAHDCLIGLHGIPLGPDHDEAAIARHFTRANKDRIAELLETLASLGKARQLDDGRFTSV